MLAGLLLSSSAYSQAFTENFDDITTLSGSGWAMYNNSTPVGLIANWFQGSAISAGGPFDAYNGATNAYIAANYNFVTGANTISGWLITPNRTFKNGDVITFYTRKPSPDNYPDRLEVRLSTNGASTNVGATNTSVGDFTTLLTSVNGGLVTGVYPTTWTQYTVTISGLSAPTSGRIAFRYFVTNGGPSGANSDYIGIDNVVYTPYVCPTFTMTTAGALSSGTAGSSYSTSLTQTGALGAPNFAVTAGALPPGMTLSSSGTISGTPTATGTFNFSVTVSDASGCSGSSSYSITVVCPPNPTSLNGMPALCSNGGTYTLVEGSPAGGTYSGTGVSGGTFDPTAGTQMITYDYTDPYGCAHSTSNNIVVNAAPTAVLSAFTDVCEDAGMVALSGGMPAGGIYSGTGVSGGNFDAASGTQTITYTYTDVNGCTDTDMQTMTVNSLPTVALTAFNAVCEDNGMVTLSGGSPAGGVYSGTGVSGGDFDPSNGTQMITYTYTDGNGCAGSAMESMPVNALPAVSLSAFNAVCEDNGNVTLSGGAPAGGVYSGTGVSGGDFDPSNGTQLITYSFTDGNGCTGQAMESLTVNPLPNVGLVLPVTEMCVTHAAQALSGGTPTGGVFSGAGVSGGSFDPATAGLGTHDVTYTYVDGNGCTGEAMASIVVGDCAGIEEGELAALVVYPNPSNGIFVISGIETSKLTNLVVTDMTGKQVKVAVENEVNGIRIDLTQVRAGYYLLTGLADGQAFRLKLEKVD